MIAPYRKDLTARVAATIEEHGIAVRQALSLEIADDVAVGRLDQHELLSMACEMDLANSDALVLSAGVQMPSLEVLDAVEQLLGLPVISAATATVWALLQKLRIEPKVRAAGWLLRSSCSHAHRCCGARRAHRRPERRLVFAALTERSYSARRRIAVASCGSHVHRSSHAEDHTVSLVREGGRRGRQALRLDLSRLAHRQGRLDADASRRAARRGR